MLTEEQIAANKERYLDLINSITAPNAKIDKFVEWLSKSDFFIAPASMKYHCNYKGGLCQHSLNVYDELKLQVENHRALLKSDYSDDTIKIVALLHDISKTNFYELYLKNVKNEETGQWEKQPDYRMRENRLFYGTHKENSEYITRKFFPLTMEESSAIINHHAGMSEGQAKDLSIIYDRFSLATLLHIADMIATYIHESNN